MWVYYCIRRLCSGCMQCHTYIQIFHVHILLGTFMCIVILATGTAGNSMCCMRRCGPNGAYKCIDSLGLRAWNWDVNYIHCWTLHVATLSLQELMAPLTLTLVSFSRPCPAFCRLQCAELHRKDVDCSLFGSTCTCSRSASLDAIARSSIDLQGW